MILENWIYCCRFFQKCIRKPFLTPDRGLFPPCSYANTAFWAQFSRLCMYLQNLRKFNAPILQPNQNLPRINPRTGMQSTRYFLLRMDGIVSTPLRKRDSSLKASVLRYLCCSARRLAFTDTVFLLTLLNILGWHCFLYGHCSHWFLWNDTTHWPVLWL